MNRDFFSHRSDSPKSQPIFDAVDKNNQELVHFLLEKDGTVATR
jgi:hypothetical protein